ncbi:MAG: SRPBCC family protein [Colwellia sp.]|nr:SRPBCC family protein [Colwellia sp.]
MITIKVEQQVPAPVEQVRNTLLDHQHLARFFNAKFSIVKRENNGELIGGKGAVRQVTIGRIVFKEQIISAEHNHVCYRIIGKGPVSEHQGDIYLTSVDTSSPQAATQLDYIIKFIGPKWCPNGILKFFIERDIQKAMKKLAQHFV